jgi:hypothetical protein
MFADIHIIGLALDAEAQAGDPPQPCDSKYGEVLSRVSIQEALISRGGSPIWILGRPRLVGVPDVVRPDAVYPVLYRLGSGGGQLVTRPVIAAALATYHVAEPVETRAELGARRNIFTDWA